MKKCSTCKETKELTEFHKDSGRGDGLAGRCKPCARANARKYAKPCVPRVYAPGEKAAHNARYTARFPRKTAAHRRFNLEIEMGRVCRGPCEQGLDCRGGVHAHHDDYAKPLDVRWLCAKHHREWHRRNGPGVNGD
jgi:hypothetical protein